VSAAAVKALQIAASFVFMPFLLRGFGLANYGVFVLASSVSVYLGLLDFGVSSTVTKFVAEHRARNEDVGLGRVVSNVVAYYTAVGILACVGLLLFARFGVGIFRLRPADMVLARDLFTVSGVVALFAWPLGIGSSVLGGLQRSTPGRSSSSPPWGPWRSSAASPAAPRHGDNSDRRCRCRGGSFAGPPWSVY
jgi:O-antigen/teichoic acid export membrane protein